MEEEEQAGAQDPRVAAILSRFDSAVTFEQRLAASAPAAARPDERDEQAARRDTARDAVFQFASGILGLQEGGAQGDMIVTRGALERACRRGGDKCVRCSLMQVMPLTLEQSGLAHTLPHSTECPSAQRRASVEVELGTWAGNAGKPCQRWMFGACNGCGLQPSSGTLAKSSGPTARLCHTCHNARKRAEDPHQWAIAQARIQARYSHRRARNKQQQPPGVGDRALRVDHNFGERQWLGPRVDCAATQHGAEIFENLRTHVEYDAPASHQALMALAQGVQSIPGSHETHYALDIQTGADGDFAVLWRNIDFCPAYLRGASRDRSDLTSILYSILLTVVRNKDKVSLFVFGEMLPYKHGGRTAVSFVSMELACSAVASLALL